MTRHRSCSGCPDVPGDAGVLVVGFVIKLALVLGLVAVVGYDAISLVHTRLTAADAANTAAAAAAENYRGSRNIQLAYNAALAAAGSPDATIDTGTFKVAPDGGVSLRLHLHATTLLVHRIPPLRSWEDASEVGTAGPPL